MKKFLNYPILFLAILSVLASCDPKEDDIEQKVSEVTVLLPDDLEEIELDYQAPQKPLAVEWKTEEEVSYQFVLSLKEDMSNPATISLNNVGVDAITHHELDSVMGVLGVKIYNRAELYWVIKGIKGTNSGTSKSRIMELWRFMNPFVDPRDGEIYRVTKVVDPLTGDYWIWMADNMRCKKYSDGTPLNIGTDVLFLNNLPGDSEHKKEWNRLRGGYYTWNATVRDVAAAEKGDKVQGIAPAGWRIATKQDWDNLLNLQEDNSNPGTYLKDGSYWLASALDFGKNTSKFNAVASGFFWEPLKDRTPENVLEQENISLFWTSTVPVAGDEIPWNPPASAFPTQAYSRALDANSSGSALYVYDRMRGYTVRCVLN